MFVPLADFEPFCLPIQPIQKPSPEIPMLKFPRAALRIMELSAKPTVCVVSRSSLPEAVLNQISWRGRHRLSTRLHGSRRERCTTCGQKHSAGGFNLSNECKVNEISKSLLSRLPLLSGKTK